MVRANKYLSNGSMCVIGLFLASSGISFGQASITPWINIQFTDSSGKALSGGRVFSCNAGSSCPGSPLPTYTSSSGFTANTNPVILNGAGRASIWLTPGLAYRFVVTTSTGVIVPDAGGDNIIAASTSGSGGGGGGGGSGTPGGANTNVQYNCIGAFCGDTTFTWNSASKILTVTGVAGTAGIVSANGFIQSSGGFLSSVTGGSWQGINTNTDGGLLRGLSVAQNSSNTKGGYLDLAPVTYNPYDGSPCLDASGNAVQQPLPLPGLSNFGTNDAILWVGTSPQMPAGGSCGAPLPISNLIGLNTNSYFFARGGLATDLLAYNAINTIYQGAGHPAGGVTAGTFVAGTLYPIGTVTTTTTLVAATYLGGYVQVGHSATPPDVGTISTVTNPLVQGDGLVQGTLYWDDALHCFNGRKDDSTWACLSTVGGAGAGTVNSGVITQVAYYAATGAAVSGNAAFLWNPATPQVSLAGTFQTNGATYGFNASTCTNTDCIQAALGGILGKTLRTTDSVIWVEEAAPAVSAAGQCRSYDDSTLHTLLLSCNGAAYAAFGGGGGSGTVSAASQYQLAYYPGAGTTTTVAGNAALLFNPATPQISFAGNYQTNGTTYGFNASSCTSANCIQAAVGGLSAKWSTVSDSTFWLEEVAPSISASGQCRAYDDSTFHNLFLSCNGGPYLSIGGGSGTVSSSSQFFVAYYPNNGATVNGNNGFQYSPGAGQVSLSGFFQANGATGGFTAPTDTAFNTIQAVSGGVLARNGSFLKYVQIGNNSGAPTMSPGDTVNPGTMYWDIGLAAARIWNGFSYSTLSTGGISSLNSLTGALNIAGTTNEITVSAVGTTITLATPQAIGTASGPTFASVTANGAFNSTVTGATIGLQVNGGSFQVSGAGAVSTAGAVTTSSGFNSTNTALNSIQTAGNINACNGGACSGGSAFSIVGSPIITSAGFYLGRLNMPLSGNSVIYTGTGGNFYTRFTGGSTGISCAAVTDGWLAVTSDDFVVVCIGGSRFRSALTAF